jgi:hypothetical protein
MASVDVTENRKISCPYQKSNPDASVAQLVAYMLYRLSNLCILANVQKTDLSSDTKVNPCKHNYMISTSHVVSNCGISDYGTIFECDVKMLADDAI